MNRSPARKQRADDPGQPHPFPAAAGIVLILIAVFILTTGILYQHTERKALTERIETELMTVATLKADKINFWYRERITDAVVFISNQWLLNTIPAWLADPDPRISRILLYQFSLMAEKYRYTDILLVDRRMECRLSLSGRLSGMDETENASIRNVLKNRRPSPLDIHIMGDRSQPHIDIIVPLVNQWGSDTVTNEEPAGVLIFQADPWQFLFPLLTEWPSESKTAESYIVRREGDDVLFLTTPRHLQGTEREFRIPLSEGDSPAVQAAMGKTGIVTGRDYRGIQVIAAVKSIPDSSWLLITKIDREEAFGPVRRQSARIIGSTLILLISATVIILLLWQRREKLHYQELARTRLDLHRSEGFYRTTLLSIGDGVITADKDGKILMMNKVSEDLTGWKNEEALGRSIQEVFRALNEETREPIGNMSADILDSGKTAGHGSMALLVSRNGLEYPIVMNGSPIYGEKEARGVVLVFRDQTQDRKIQEALKWSETRFRNLFNNSVSGIAIHQIVFDNKGKPVNYRFLMVNSAFENHTGLKRDDVVGKFVTEAIPGTDAPPYLEIYADVALRGGNVSFETFFVPLGRAYRITSYQVEYGFFATVFSDITREKISQTERDLTIELLKLANSRRALQELLREVVILIQEWSGIEAVGIRLKRGDDFPCFESRGFPADFLEAEGASFVNDAECPCGSVLRGRIEPTLPCYTPGGSFFANSVSELLSSDIGSVFPDETRKRLKRNGYESVALIPLRFAGEILGLLQLNDSRRNRFPFERILFLEQLADNLAAGISEREIREDLSESEEKYRELVENVDSVILKWDRDGNILFMNAYGLSFFGFPEEEIIGRNVVGTIVPAERGIGGEGFVSAMFSHPERYAVQVSRNIRMDGSMVWVSWTNRVVPDEKGMANVMLSIGQDVTERIEAEEQLRKALAEKETLIRELYHRTKNNMQVIISLFSLHSRHIGDERLLGVMEEMQNRIRAMALVNQSLYQSRDLSHIRLDDYIRELAPLLLGGMDLEPGHIGISFDLAELETVIDVAIPFGLIFTELVSNTVRHAFPGQRRGTIEVRLKRTDPDFLEFVYRDDGIGIDPALDVRMSGTIGFQTIFALVEHQLQGSASFEPVGRGVKWIIRFSDTQFSARV